MNAEKLPSSPHNYWFRGAWFWGALLIGAVVRLHFVFLTEGTYDVEVWQAHVLALGEQDLASYYRGGSYRFNHPPPISLFIVNLFPLAKSSGIAFAALLRLPFVLFDLAGVWLILRLLAGHPSARVIAAAFWLHPLAAIYSGYHGNTDSSIAFFLLAATWAVSGGRGGVAGAILGLSLWIKIPGLLAGPGLLFALDSNRERLRFCLAGAAVAAIGFGPALASDAEALIEAVFLYPGLNIHTSSGIAIWGLLNLLPDPSSLPEPLRLPLLDLREFIRDYNTLICVAPIFLFAWLRRRSRDVTGLAGTIAGSFALFYGLTNSWAFQYLAWSVPFWLICSRSFGALASFFAVLYVYGAYAWLCGDWLLLGEWDFVGKPDWPAWLLASRDAANVFFLVAGFYFLGRALTDEMRNWRSEPLSPVRD